MMSDRERDLTRILIEYGNHCGQGSSFSSRLEAMTAARLEIEELFRAVSPIPQQDAK